MYCTKKIASDLVWVGANDRRLAMFEGVYSVPAGVSYNSYLLTDEKTVLFDTVDKAVSRTFFENLEHELGGRPLDYVIVHHMEPDHSATLSELLLRHPETTVVCNDKTAVMIAQFFGKDAVKNMQLVKEGDVLSAGAHELTFYLAPMIHWPEVMMTYDKSAHTLFTADAFGVFGALNGAIFADEVDFDRDYLKEARRYYTNIVGKYGVQVQNLFKKIAGLDIQMLCPLHGFVWRRDLGYILEKYNLWSTYTPEDKGVMIAYASIYGNTENAAEILASKLRERGVRTAMYDVSVTPGLGHHRRVLPVEPSGVCLGDVQRRHFRHDGRAAARYCRAQSPEAHRRFYGKRHVGARQRAADGGDPRSAQEHDGARAERRNPLLAHRRAARRDRSARRCDRGGHPVKTGNEK